MGKSSTCLGLLLCLFHTIQTAPNPNLFDVILDNVLHLNYPPGRKGFNESCHWTQFNFLAEPCDKDKELECQRSYLFEANYTGWSKTAMCKCKHSDFKYNFDQSKCTNKTETTQRVTVASKENDLRLVADIDSEKVSRSQGGVAVCSTIVAIAVSIHLFK